MKKTKVIKVKENPIPIENNYLETFKYKQFARNYVLTNGDDRKAYLMTFGQGDSPMKMFANANSILQKPEVQLEIQKLLPTEQDLAEVIQSALDAPVPTFIKWSEKHQFVETALKLRGYLKPEAVKTQVNIGMVIKE